MKNPRQNSPKTAFALVAIIIAGLISIPAPARAAGRQTLNFNPDWKFIRSDPTNAQAPGFDDRNWTAVSTPHTYNDTDTFDNFNLPGLRGETNQWGGRTWYRKTFTAPKSWRGKKVYIEFDAVRQVAEVYLNGHCLGACKNGFLPFGFDLTPGLNIGTTNVLAVMCDNTFMFNPMPPKGAKKNNGPEGIKALARRLARLNALIPDKVSQLTAGEIPWNNPQWHPAMGGIYRDVKLIVTDPLHVSLPLYDFLKTEGPYIYATNISVKSAVLNVQVPVENDGPSQLRADLSVQILDHHGINVLSLTPMPAHDNTLFPGAHSMFAASAILQNPRLWEQDYPYLYRARIVLKSDGKIADVCDIPFGIRAVHWSVKTGFWINGHHVKLHGWGQKPMDEWPGLGDAMPDWMQFYTIQLMKQAGGNWIRWGHCAAGPAQIQSSDELGLGVEQPGVDGEHDTIKAAWTVRARAFRDDIIFYRNDPSILVWEAGNQKVTPAHAAQLRGYFEKYDPFGGRALAFRRADKITAHYMDVSVGTEGSHEAPRLPVIEGEYDREESPRRVWDAFSPPNTNYAALQKGQSYNLNSEQFAVNEIKNYVDKLGAPNHCGGANWIFSDSTSGGRNTTEVDRASGEVDAVRLPKQAYYVCQAMWLNRPAVHIIGHWTYPPGTVKNVYVASNCRRVQLLLNGKSLGFGSRSDTYLFTFTNVLFQPGLLKAVGYNHGAIVVMDSIRTAGPPVALRMTVMTGPGGLRACGSDVALIDVEAVDSSGERCPTFQRRVNFTCTGPAVWRGGYNSGQTNTINKKHLDLECGVNRVAVRSTLRPGRIKVAAACPGLNSASVTIVSHRFPWKDAFSWRMPPLPSVRLPGIHPSWAALQKPVPPITVTSFSGNVPWVGRYTESFAYTGPTPGANLQTNAADGCRVYSDTNFTFANLPDVLSGADWLRLPDADSLYDAADLIQIADPGRTDVYVAHDTRLPVPEWLARQFKELKGVAITVNGVPMQLFRHGSSDEESVTLGSNTSDDSIKQANAYIVFIKSQPPAKKSTP